MTCKWCGGRGYVMLCDPADPLSPYKSETCRCDSRLKREAPRRETGSAPQGAKAAVPSGNRPEIPPYFWLGIQAEGTS